MRPRCSPDQSPFCIHRDDLVGSHDGREHVVECLGRARASHRFHTHHSANGSGDRKRPRRSAIRAGRLAQRSSSVMVRPRHARDISTADLTPGRPRRALRRRLFSAPRRGAGLSGQIDARCVLIPFERRAMARHLASRRRTLAGRRWSRNPHKGVLPRDPGLLRGVGPASADLCRREASPAMYGTTRRVVAADGASHDDPFPARHAPRDPARPTSYVVQEAGGLVAGPGEDGFVGEQRHGRAP